MLNKVKNEKMDERRRRIKRENMNRVLSLNFNFSGKSAIKKCKYICREMVCWRGGKRHPCERAKEQSS